MPLFITARSQDSRILDDAVKSIVTKANDFGVSVEGPFPIPTKNSRTSKDSGLRTCLHGRFFQLNGTTPEFVVAIHDMKIFGAIAFTIIQY